MQERAHVSRKSSATTDSGGHADAHGSSARPRIRDASAEQWLGSNADPDVLLSVPELKVDKIALQVKELRADVDVQVRVLDVLDLRVGAHVTLGEVDLDIENVAAQAMLKVRLDEVAAMVEQVLAAVTANPALGSGSGVAVRVDDPGAEVVEASHREVHDAKPTRKRAARKTATTRRKKSET